MAAASNFGLNSSTSSSVGTTHASSATTVTPARRAGTMSQPPGQGTTPPSILYGSLAVMTWSPDQALTNSPAPVLAA